MTRIFKRDTLISNTKPKKQYEEKRKRNIIMNYRVTPEEKELINRRMELTGLKKSDYFIQSCMHQNITVLGNVKTYEAMKEKIAIIDKHLTQITTVEELDINILEYLRTILEILDNVLGEKSNVDEKLED